MYLSISAAAYYLGVSISTLRRWHNDEILIPDFLTPGGHRRYSVHSLKEFVGEEIANIDKKPVIYGRVSSHDQKADLERQIERLVAHCQKIGIEDPLIIKDLGSGLKYNKPGLNKLLKLILNGQISVLFLHHKDRLLRFGSELIFNMCDYMKIKVIILEEDMSQSFEQELAADVLEIITVFSARLYGRRSHQNNNMSSQQKAA